MCKAKALVDLLPNMLTEVNGQTSLETLVKVKAEEVVVENEEALANKYPASRVASIFPR